MPDIESVHTESIPRPPAIGKALKLVGPFVALQGLALLALAVVFNMILFITVAALANYRIIQGGAFPALVVFLSFALSIGIILINGLGEQINTKAIQNPLIKKFGVTPIMVIVAVLIAMFTSFTPVASKMFPASELEIMLTGIDFSCKAINQIHPPQATDLLTVISAEDADYIDEVTKYLKDTDPKAFVPQRTHGQPLTLVNKEASDEMYKLIMQRATDDGWSWDLRGPEKWVAYTIHAKAPSQQTPLPIPVRFKTPHTTRLFVVVKQTPKSSQPELDVLSPEGAEGKDIWPLMTVGIKPDQPLKQSQRTDFDVQVYAHPGHLCWHIGA
jgi:hypothetical protein